MDAPTHSAPADGRDDALGLAAAAGGLLATAVTAAACVGPLVAIVLGVGGFGWLTQYAHLRVPASIATFALLAVGFAWVYRRPRQACRAEGARRRRRWARVVLWTAVALAVATNVFEYLVFPSL